MQRSFLAIYLRDHHAAAIAGTRLARRIARAHATTSDLSGVASEIHKDLVALESIMRSLGVERDGMKDALARIGERLGRLKPNGRLRERSPLSDVLELETLLVGITGKRALWLSLRATRLPRGRTSTTWSSEQKARRGLLRRHGYKPSNELSVPAKSEREPRIGLRSCGGHPSGSCRRPRLSGGD